MPNDDGQTWYHLNSSIGDGFDFTTTWGNRAGPMNEHYQRGYWQTTSTSIRMIIADNKFYDNSGWLGWRLYSANPFPSH